jgi:hypothetical protein
MKIPIGWVAINKVTKEVRTGSAYSAGGKIYKSLPMAKAAVKNSSIYEFKEVFYEV